MVHFVLGMSAAGAIARHRRAPNAKPGNSGSVSRNSIIVDRHLPPAGSSDPR